MSDYMPFEIQMQIIERLPVRSLLQFRSVSKTWKSLIDSSEFMVTHNVRHSQSQRLLVRYVDPRNECEETYVSFVDDNTFPQQKFSHTVPWFVKQLKLSKFVGRCQGLLCLYGYYVEPEYPLFTIRKNLAVLWNPSIRKSVAVNMPHLLTIQHRIVLGFGVRPDTGDPKIIHLFKDSEMEMISGSPWQVRVFTLSLGKWESRSRNLPRGLIRFTMPMYETVVIDRFIYWSVCEEIAKDGDILGKKLIVSYDMINDEFREVYLPDSLALNHGILLTIDKLRESLVVIEKRHYAGMHGCSVWMMENGVPTSFKKLFTFNSPYSSSINNVLGFRKTGDALLEFKIPELFYGSVELAVYEPCSQYINNIGITGYDSSFFMKSYTETLLLLNQPEVIVP